MRFLFLIACAAPPSAFIPSTLTQAETSFGIDATLEGPEGTYFFTGERYRRMQGDQFNDGGSLPLFAFHLPFSRIDAALAGNGYAYFFRGGEFARYSWATNRVDLRGSLTLWHLSFDAVDAAFNHAGKAYFFRGNRYAVYDWATNSIDLEGEWELPGPFDAAVDRGDVAVFIQGDRFTEYTWSTGEQRVILWPALNALRESPSKRVLLYVTIDTSDHAGTGRHNPNLAGLRAHASSWRATTYVDDFWAPQVTRAMLDDPHVLGLFGSGSFDEWASYFPGQHPVFAHWAPLLRAGVPPALMVCGSHQFSALAFEGLHSVRHVGTETTVEIDGIARIPNPRPGEWGSYPITLTNDPLFEGLPNPASFSEYHHDEVVAGALQQFSLIATGDITRVQAIKHKKRLYYGVQFHPELDDNPNGRKLLHNFLNLAAAQ